MASLVLTGDTSGQVTLAAAAVAGTNTITVQAATGTMSVNTLATAVASTSGTSIDFTGLPSWIKRITVMFSGVSTNGTANPLIQFGSGSIQTTGYASVGSDGGTGFASTASTTGFRIGAGAATASAFAGSIIFSTLGSNVWVGSGVFYRGDAAVTSFGSGTVTLSGAIDRLRITTTNGTDTFDAGTVNILYEG